MLARTITLSSNELWPLLNILNEICYGISIHDFENSIGTKQEVVEALMSKISLESSTKEIVLRLSEFEINVLKRVFEKVCSEIDDWEFPTRIGISKQEVCKIYSCFPLSLTT